MLRQVINRLPRFLRRQKLLTALYQARIASPVQLLEFNSNARAWIDLRDAESRASYLSQSFWPEFHPMVAAFLHDGGNLFDVGANFGLVTFGAVHLVAGQRIGFHLFEANPRIVPLLERSAGLYPGEQFFINHCCVTDRAGVSRLTLPDASWGHAHIAESGQEIKNLILDDYIAEKQIKRIAFMKMDVEGWELHVLRGAERSLSAGIVEAAFVEVDPYSLLRAGTSESELLSLLDSFGFDLYFCAMWDSPDPHNLKWIRTSVGGTSLRFAKAAPLPSTYKSGDVMAIHRSTRLGATLKKSAL